MALIGALASAMPVRSATTPAAPTVVAPVSSRRRLSNTSRVIMIALLLNDLRYFNQSSVTQQCLDATRLPLRPEPERIPSPRSRPVRADQFRPGAGRRRTVPAA